MDDANVEKSKLAFYDAYAGLSHRFSSNSTADVTFYSSADEFRYSNQFGYRWNNYLINGRWQAFADRNASPTLSISYGHFKSTQYDPSGVEASEITNTLNYLQLSETVNFIPNEKHSVVGGISGIGYFPKPEQREGYNGNPSIVKKSVEKNSGLELAFFLNDDYTISERFGISLGLRYSHYTHLGEDTVFTYAENIPKSISSIEDTLYYSKFEKIKTFSGFEPRISARFNVTSNQSIKASYNRMRQYIHLISNTTSRNTN